MEGEKSQLLALFDFYWFRQHVLRSGGPLPDIPLPPHNPGPAAAAAVPEANGAGEPHSPRHESSPHRRSRSDELALASSSSCSDVALTARRPLKLETIFSGKATSREEEEHRGADALGRGSAEEDSRGSAADRERRRRNHGESRRRRTRAASQGGGKSKSLSELEFEELKGLMDLGFTFSEAESDQRLLSIVPGLQRLGQRRSSEEERAPEEAKEGGLGADESSIPRPYLSEAWAVAEIRENRRSHAHDHLLRNWRVPAAADGVDMKDHLRSWAHTVASAVR